MLRGAAIALALIAVTAPGAAADDALPFSAATRLSAAEGDSPTDPVTSKPQRYTPQAPGTKTTTTYWFGPYTVPPGQDANKVDLDLPVRDGYIVSIAPKLVRASDMGRPSRQEAHIHHAHWFAADPGNEEDNYTGGNTEWVFGTGDEETPADFQERSAADPNGPVYGQYVGAAGPQLMIFMLHNKTSAAFEGWMALDVTFVSGTKKEIADLGGRPYHDVSGVLFGRTYDVPRQAAGDGRFETTRDQSKPIVWTATQDGTIIGTGSHLHPGGLEVAVENLGSEQRPCPDDGRAYGGTTLLRSDAIYRLGAPFSEEFAMEVTRPQWRAPVRKGDRIRITGIYENKDHAWYDVMTHQGIYVDTEQKPADGCKPYFVGGLKERRTVVRRKRHIHFGLARNGSLVRRVHIHRKRRSTGTDLVAGVAARQWGPNPDPICGEAFGAPPCERSATAPPAGPPTDEVRIADFLYLPGDASLAGDLGRPPTVKQGTSLAFTNADVILGIRHSITTCANPCNGQYVANYPLPDGRWDSETLGYDAIDGGELNPIARTPPDLALGRYTYYCRIHPWMRGAFEVVA